MIAAMFALRRSLNPPKELGWSDPDPCNWPHVGCSPDKRVTRIQIGNQNLTGTLPSSLSNLTQLERLEVQGNSIYGPLPTLGGLASLQVILLSDNQSSIFFFWMSSLQSIVIDNNPFSAWKSPESEAISGEMRFFILILPHLHRCKQCFIPQTLSPGLYVKNLLVSQHSVNSMYRITISLAKYHLSTLTFLCEDGSVDTNKKYGINSNLRLLLRLKFVIDIYLDGNEKLIVFEYMPHGTLSRHTVGMDEKVDHCVGCREGRKGRPLRWMSRGELNTFLNKPSNILLGDDMRAKVGDFELVWSAFEGKASIWYFWIHTSRICSNRKSDY